MAVPEKALTPIDINLPVAQDMEAVKAVLAENLEGVTPRFDRIKIPSGGGIAFEVPNENGEADSVKELVGVIVDHHAANAYWRDKYSGQGNPPDCSSLDGKFGTATPDSGLEWAGGERECASCPLNQFGSGEGGRGKACKNMHRLFVLLEGELLPKVLTLPPTSLGEWTAHVTRLSSRAKAVSAVVTRIKLTKASNKDGIAYSQAVFTKAGDLAPEVAAAVRAHAAALRPFTRKLTIEAEDYQVEGNGNGRTRVGDSPI